MDAMKNMLTRTSVKKYKSDPVPKELIDQIIEAGTHAASGLNKQSPIILAVTNTQVRDELSKLNMGKDPFHRADPFYGAPCVLVVLADKSVHTHVYDGSLVMGNMLLAAHSLGIGACWVHRAREVFETEEWREWLRGLGVADEYEGIGNCVIGYLDGEYPAPKEVRDGRVFFAE